MIRAGLSSYDNYSRLRDRRRKVIRFLFFVLVLQYSLTLVGSLLLNSRSLATGESTVDLPSGTRMLLSPLPISLSTSFLGQFVQRRPSPGQTQFP